MDAKITNSNENKANPVNYSTQGFTGDPFLFSVLMRLFYNNLLCLGSLVLLESADAVHAGRGVRLNLG